jgi:hypothetical protein
MEIWKMLMRLLIRLEHRFLRLNIYQSRHQMLQILRNPNPPLNLNLRLFHLTNLGRLLQELLELRQVKTHLLIRLTQELGHQVL